MITLKDLANTLGVSVSTVSKALKDSPEISKATIERVKEVAKELNYRPNTLALSLKNRKTKTLGVLIPDILNPFFSTALHGIEQEATRKGYNIITCITGESFEKERNTIHLLSNGSVDGFLISISQETQEKADFDHLVGVAKQDVPVVMFDRTSHMMNCDKVIIDDFGAVFSAVNHLINEGRKKIILFNNLGDINVAKLRILGYKTALEKSSLTNQRPIIHEVEGGDNNIQDGLLSLLDNYQDVDAVLCIDNKSGLVAIHTFKKKGFDVPSDISILGFASEDIAYLSDPALSTITQRAEEMGKQAVGQLIQRLEGDSKANAVTRTVDYTLEHRGTTLI